MWGSPKFHGSDTSVFLEHVGTDWHAEARCIVENVSDEIVVF